MKFLRLFTRKVSRMCLTAAAFVLTATLAAQGTPSLPLAADDLRDGASVELHKSAWKYRAGDETAWAAHDFDDANWQSITNDEINSDPTKLENWNGRAWFRLRLQVDESLANQPLALRVWHWGASEIYLDGQLVERFGRIEIDGGEEEFNPRGLFTPVVFVGGGTHVIAVRHSFQAMRDLTGGRGWWLARDEYAPGFRLQLEPAAGAAMRLNNRVRSNFFEYLFVGLFSALAAVHLLLFAFYPAERGNLYYSFFVGGLAFTIFLNRLYFTGDVTAETHLLTDIVRNIGQVFAMASLLAFLYIEFVGGISRFFWAIIALWTISIGLTVAHLSLPFPHFLMMLGVTFADCLRIIGQSLARRRPGARNIAAGVGLLIFGVANNITFEREMHFLPVWLKEYNLYAALLSVPIAVSIYLARSFARTNKTLAAQLVKAVEHEKEKSRLLVVEAENERRAQELEEARLLQLSMLPKKVPQMPNLEIAAYMRPATEVGGDYYDFHTGKDGTLTVAVGDATGHGLRAGSIVTATKSLFNAFAGESDVPLTLKRINLALKQMNLRGLFMAMTIVKIKDTRLTISAAGMPSAIVYRSRTERCEEIVIRALPLGSVSNFPYQQQHFDLSVGDCVLLMSDGFPEMFNESNKMIGFDKAAEVLPTIARRTAAEIVDHLVHVGETWAGTRPADDDVTFVVLKIKAVGDAFENGSNA